MTMYTLILVFAGIGILNTLYLSYHALTKTDVWCLGFPPEWCRKVQHSPQSKTLGIPNPYLGLGMYLGIAALTWLATVGTLSFWPAAALIYFGLLFSLYFLYVQAFVLQAFCTWCVLSAVDFIVLAFVAYSILI